VGPYVPGYLAQTPKWWIPPLNKYARGATEEETLTKFTPENRTVGRDPRESSRPRRVHLESGAAQSEPKATLVVGFDRQVESHAALRVAVDLAGRLHAQLQVVHAINLADYPVDPDSSDWEDQTRQILAGERAEVTAALRNHTSGWAYHAQHGDPARLLVEVADEHDALMIIVGSRGEGGRQWLERLFDPSVSHRVIREGRRPILVVSHPPQHL